MKSDSKPHRFRRLVRISVLLIAGTIFCRFGFGLNFTSVSLAAASLSGAPVSESIAVHGGSVSLILISLVVILTSAKLGGALMERIHQPAVLGELIFGVLLGNLSLLGLHQFEYLKSNEAIGILAELGVIFLLFEVGLESNIKQMMEVGLSSFLVALVGVIVPMILGWGVGCVVSASIQHPCACSSERPFARPASGSQHGC